MIFSPGVQPKRSLIVPTKFLKPPSIVHPRRISKMICSYGRKLKPPLIGLIKFPKLPSIVPPKATLQDDQQTWASAEAVLDRAHKVSEAALDRAAKDDLQTDLLLWKSAEAILDRAHKVSEAALDRQLKLDLQDDQQDWKTSENALDRAHDLAILDAKVRSRRRARNRSHRSPYLLFKIPMSPPTLFGMKMFNLFFFFHLSPFKLSANTFWRYPCPNNFSA
jgi:hypothetical protein